MSGEVRGILAVECDSDVLRKSSSSKRQKQTEDESKSPKIRTKDSSRGVFSNREDEATIERLMQEKQSLSLELQSLGNVSPTASTKKKRNSESKNNNDIDLENQSISIEAKRGKNSIVLKIETSEKSCVIRYLEIQEQSGEAIVSCPRKPSCRHQVNISPSRDVRTMLKVTAVVCAQGGNSHHPHRVLKKNYELAEFHMYVPRHEYLGDMKKLESFSSTSSSSSNSSLRFEARCSESEIKSWIQNAFALKEVKFKQQSEPGDAVVCEFLSLRDVRFFLILQQFFFLSLS